MGRLHSRPEEFMTSSSEGLEAYGEMTLAVHMSRNLRGLSDNNRCSVELHASSLPAMAYMYTFLLLLEVFSRRLPIHNVTGYLINAGDLGSWIIWRWTARSENPIEDLGLTGAVAMSILNLLPPVCTISGVSGRIDTLID